MRAGDCKSKKLSYLLVVPSSCQTTSGTGTAIYDWIRFSKKYFDFTILMDIENIFNYKYIRAFCDENNVKMVPSRGLKLPGCADTGILCLNEHLEKNKYHFVESVSWANASTNLSILTSTRHRSKLIFTPHAQPIETLVNYEKYFMTKSVFRDMVDAADFVIVDSTQEAKLEIFPQSEGANINFIPLGVDTNLYHPDPKEENTYYILFVGDCNEYRKRIDILISVFELLHEMDAKLKLVIVGKGSKQINIPDSISSSVQRLGFVDQPSLIKLYQTVLLFIMLSDYEAFCLPVAEALCTGCPVILNNTSVLSSLFLGIPGVIFVDNRNEKDIANKVMGLIKQKPSRSSIADHASAIFSLERTYGQKLSLLLDGNQGKCQ